MPKQYYWFKQNLTRYRQVRAEKNARKKPGHSRTIEQGLTKVKNTISEVISCPVCLSDSIQKLELEWGGYCFDKYSCNFCSHLFSHRELDGMEQLASEFEYENKTDVDLNFHLETRLAEKAIEEFRKLNGELSRQSHLIFGVGKNFQLVENMNNIHFDELFSVDGCDLNNRDGNNFFKTYTDDTKLGSYTSISSHAVIEHLENTIEAWLYLNRLLKPANEIDCIMVHAFPSLIHFDRDDWSIKIRSHTCLFSEKSLARICKLSGFRLLHTAMSSSHHPIFVFLKTEDR